MAVSKDKKTGKWVCKFRYHDLSGKSIQKRKIGFAKKKEAQAWETDFLAQHEGKERLTFAQAYARYLTDCAKRQKKVTVAEKRKNYRYFEAFYPLPVADITPAKIRSWQNDKLLQTDEDGVMRYTKSTIQNINTGLSGFFSWAMKFCGLDKNPVKLAGTLAITGAREKDGTAKGEIWQIEDFNRFIATIERPDYHLFFSILFFTGLRRGEALALRIKDIDLDTGTINVVQNMTPFGIGTPKTKTSKRKVTIPDIIIEETKKYLDKIYKPAPSDLIFEALTPGRVSHYFAEKQDQVGIEKKIRIHDLRHSHASMLINLGFSPDVVADRMGHANAAMVLRVYGHMYPSKRIEVIDKLNKIAAGK